MATQAPAREPARIDLHLRYAGLVAAVFMPPLGLLLGMVSLARGQTRTGWIVIALSLAVIVAGLAVFGVAGSDTSAGLMEAVPVSSDP